MRALKSGERHHCRSCGKVVCNNCCDSAILNERIQENGDLQRLKNKDDILLSRVCKTCKIRALISDNATTKGLVDDQTFKNEGAATITRHSHKASNQGRQGQQDPHQRAVQQSQHRAQHRKHRHVAADTICSACGLGIPKDLIATFNWTDILKPTSKKHKTTDSASHQVYSETLFCHRCAFSKNDHRGGIRSASVFVTRLSPNVIGKYKFLYNQCINCTALTHIHPQRKTCTPLSRIILVAFNEYTSLVQTMVNQRPMQMDLPLHKCFFTKL